MARVSGARRRGRSHGLPARPVDRRDPTGGVPCPAKRARARWRGYARKKWLTRQQRAPSTWLAASGSWRCRRSGVPWRRRTLPLGRAERPSTAGRRAGAHQARRPEHAAFAERLDTIREAKVEDVKASAAEEDEEALRHPCREQVWEWVQQGDPFVVLEPESMAELTQEQHQRAREVSWPSRTARGTRRG